MAKWSEKAMAQGGSAAAQPMGSAAYNMDTERMKKAIQDIIDDNKKRIPVEDRQEELHGDPADHVWVDVEEEEDWLNADDWYSVNVRDGYYPLFAVLKDALNQVQNGKGAVRHGNGEPFTDQPALTITRAVGLGFPLGQAMKKIQECQRMDTDAAKRELLGAINYLAAAVLFLDE